MITKRCFTKELIALVVDTDFEYGIDSKVDIFVRSQMQRNTTKVKLWLSEIFIANLHNVTVMLGILRIIACFDYTKIFPEGQTIALAALFHKNVEVQECSVRAFESWGTVESLRVLEDLKVSTHWLQEYIDAVVSDLRKEHNKR